MERNDKEFIKRQQVDGASELSKDTHIDMNDDFTQGGHKAHFMHTDTDDASQAAVGDNDVEKFAREAAEKDKRPEDK